MKWKFTFNIKNFHTLAVLNNMVQLGLLQPLMEPQSNLLLEQINSKLDLLLVTITPDEWLTPQDTMRIFKWGKTHFFKLVADGAFPVSRPKDDNATKSRTMLIKRSDVEAYLRKHYHSVSA